MSLQNTIENMIKLDSINIDSSIHQFQLNIESKNRSNLFPWKGQFTPQLIDLLLDNYSSTNYSILDPFLGSGTVLIESARKNLKAYGTEINPAAFCISKLYKFINIEIDTRKDILNNFEKILNDEIITKHDLFSSHENDKQLSEDLKLSITGLSKKIKHENNVILLEGLIILLDYFNNELTVDKITCKWKKIKEIIFNLPYSTKEIHIFNNDARLIPIDDNSIDLIITSPPYINVFNYHQQYRSSIESIGWDLLSVAKSEIGSNRKHRGNRFYTVVQYVKDMHDCLLELMRVSKKKSRFIFIIGRESNVCKTPFFNSEIVASLGMIIGLKIIARQERFFTNRFGQVIYEDLIHFENTKNIISTKESINSFIKEIFKDALNRVPDEYEALLNQTVEKIEQIQSSPIYGG